MDVRDGAGRIGDRWNLAATTTALVFALTIPLLPIVGEVSETVDSSGAVVRESTSRSLLETQGPGIVAVAMIPAVITAAPMLARTPQIKRGARVGASAALGAAAILGALSIGLFVVPTLILMVIAASRSPRG